MNREAMITIALTIACCLASILWVAAGEYTSSAILSVAALHFSTKGGSK